MQQLDLLKIMKGAYSASPNEVSFLKVPPLNYLMVDGEGDPNTSQVYKDSLQTLYSLAYALKFAIKKGSQAVDFQVMPLEGLWWVEDMRLFSVENKSEWQWTMMILQPDLVTADLVVELRNQVAKKKALPLVDKVRFESHEEGDCAQILHLGPYSTEGANIARLHAVIIEKGYHLNGKHHEIYLNTPLKTAPEKLKTILRQPLAK